MVLFMSGFQYILGYTPMMVKPSIFQLSRLSFFKGCIQCIVYIYICDIGHVVEIKVEPQEKDEVRGINCNYTLW